MESANAIKPPDYDEATSPPQEEYRGTKVRLNVGGQKFTTWTSTLAKLPGTRLSRLTMEEPAYDHEEKEYFFDRNPGLFSYVLDAYRYGEVHFPESVCVTTFKAELLYWGLGEQLIPACCWKTFSTWAGDQETSALVDASLNPSSPTEAVGWKNKVHAVWRFLDDARSSKFAAIWLVFYTLLLILSLAVLIASIFPERDGHKSLRDINIACSFFFLFELLIRFAACPKKRTFFCCLFNIIDILHIIPMFIYCCMVLAVNIRFTKDSVKYAAIVLLAISFFFRAVRVLKIATLSWKMQVLLLALRASLKELLMLLLMESVLMVAFGSAIFFTENYGGKDFQRIDTIAHGMWLCIITLTTVGYGDYYPKTAGGKVISGLCALSAVVLIALAVSIVVVKFNRIYKSAEFRSKVKQRAVEKQIQNIV